MKIFIVSYIHKTVPHPQKVLWNSTLFVAGEKINKYNTQKMFTASGLVFLESILKNTSNILKALWKKKFILVLPRIARNCEQLSNLMLPNIEKVNNTVLSKLWSN